MTRVMVIGNAAGGKSTLCKALAAAHDLPCYSIDALQWKPGWQRAPEADLRARHSEILAQPRWLIDGYGPAWSVEARLSACDTVIFVDHPIRIHFWWAAKRQIKSLFFGRADGPEGCPMWPVTMRLFRMMWRLHRDARPQLLKAIEARADHLRVIHITSPKALNAFAAAPR